MRENQIPATQCDAALELDAKQKRTIQARLSKIIGQVKAINKMVEQGDSGIRILTLCKATNAAVASLMLLILRDAECATISSGAETAGATAYLKNAMSILVDGAEEVLEGCP